MVAEAASTQAWPTITDAERARLARLCARLTGDADAADDLAQETLVEAWRNAHKLTDPAGRERWLAAIARNVCRRWRRSEARERAWLAPVDAAPDRADDSDGQRELERQELGALVAAALSQPRPATRYALMARYRDLAPHGQIAAELGVSEDAVAMRLARGKQAVRRLLAAEVGAGDDGWRETRVWRPECGARRLLTRRAGDALSFRCPGCHPAPDVPASEFRLTNACFARLLSGVTQPRSILNRTAAWVDDYYCGAVAAGSAPGTRCGRPTRLRVGVRADINAWRQPQPALRVRCGACGEGSSTSFSGLVLALPAAQRFWKAHGRIRALPLRELEADGVAALVASYERVGGGARLDIVSARASLALLGVHESASFRP